MVSTPVVTDQFDIRRYTADGALEVVIRRARGSRRVTAAAVEAARADRLQRIRSPAARPRIERFYAEMPVPGAMPAFEALVVDETGNLWVGEYPDPTMAMRRWSIVAPDGILLGSDVPRGLTLRGVGRDYILGTSQDELDVTHVRLYHLARPAVPRGGATAGR